jgi:hypothetical protein
MRAAWRPAGRQRGWVEAYQQLWEPVAGGLTPPAPLSRCRPCLCWPPAGRRRSARLPGRRRLQTRRLQVGRALFAVLTGRRWLVCTHMHPSLLCNLVLRSCPAPARLAHALLNCPHSSVVHPSARRGRLLRRPRGAAAGEQRGARRPGKRPAAAAAAAAAHAAG